MTSDGKPLAGAKVIFQLSADGQRWSAPTVRTAGDGTWASHRDVKDVPKQYFPESHSFLEFDLVFGDGARLSEVDADLGSGSLTVDSLGKSLASGR